MNTRAVADATRSWIGRFVVREGLCPFASASRVLVEVDTFGIDADEGCRSRRDYRNWRLDPLHSAEDAELALAALGRAEHWIDRLLSHDTAAHASSNLFIVWPVGVADPSTYQSLAAALASRAGLQLAGTTGEGSDVPAVMFPFHPTMQWSRDAVACASASGHEDFRFASPFPMVHVIPQSELGRARRRLKLKKAAGGICLQERNSSRMQEASEADRSRWQGLLAQCREATTSSSTCTSSAAAEGTRA